MKIRFDRTFSAAHRLWNDESKCRNIHGHNYRVVVELETEMLDEIGFIIPFDKIKEAIDKYDHSMILDIKDPLLGDFQGLGLIIWCFAGAPTTERFAQVLAAAIKDVVSHASVYVALRETDGIEAHARA